MIIGLATGCQTFRSAEYWWERGESSAARKDYAEATLHYQKALQKRPGYPEAAFGLGRVQLAMGERAEAFRAFRIAAEGQPDRLDFAAALGDLALTTYLGDPSHPAELYTLIESAASRALARDPGFAPALRWKAYLAASDRRPAEAEPWFRKALGREPGRADLTEGLAQSLLAQATSSAVAEAISLLRDLVTRDPDRVSAFTMIYTHYATTGEWPTAERLLLERAAARPGDVIPMAEIVRHHRRRGDWARAEESLSRLAAQGTRNPRALLMAGDLALEGGDLARAAELYRDGLGQGASAGLEYRRRLAAVYTLAGDRDRARPVIEEIVRQSPDDAEMRAAQAWLRWTPDDAAARQETVAAFEKLVRDNPDDIRFRFELGWVYRQQGDRRKASARLQEVLSRNPGHFLALASLAEMAIEDRQPDAALGFADRILAIRPGDPAGQLLRVRALLAAGRAGEARPLLSGILSRDPNDFEAGLLLARLELVQGRRATAARALEPLLKRSPPELAAWQLLVEIRSEENRPEPLLAALRPVVERERSGPRSAEWQSLWASALMAIGRYDEAIPEYAALAKLSPATAEAHFRLGLLYQLTGDFPKAVEVLREAERRSPANARVTAELAAALDQAGQLPESEAAFRRALQMEPESPLLLNNLAFLIQRRGGDLGEAAQLARRAVERDPQAAEFQATLATILLARKDFAGARRILETLVAKFPGVDAYRRQYAESLGRTGGSDR